MKNKQFIRVVAVVLSIIMLMSVAMIAITVLVGATASARVTQAQIDELRSEKRDLERQRREIQAEINTIEFERMTEILKKDVLDRRIMLTSLEIDNINAVIAYYELLIREKEYEVFLAQQREGAQLDKFKTRVRDMEENGIITYLEIIFDSTSFFDMLARIDFVSDIMRADEATHQSLIDAKNETEAAKDDLEQTKTELDEEKEYLEIKEKELEAQHEEAEALILTIEDELNSSLELRDKVQAEENRVLGEIATAVAALEAQRQEEERQRRLREQQAQQSSRSGGGGGSGMSTGSAGGTGELMWPASGTITSGFGQRLHPVFGYWSNHSGIDIGAPHGASVVAADSGTVITSVYNSSYGNYIVICHGNGVQTLYAHLSTRSVSVGAIVSRGQQIGLVGSTGISTGPHLHFEVIVNGSRVNPMNRLP